MTRLPLLICAAALLATPARADADDCPDQTQSGLNRCAFAAYEAVDDQLNATYRAVMARLKDDGDTSALLVAAQRAWIGFRDAECQFRSSAAAQGTIYPLIRAECLQAVTEQRVQELKTLLACEEGDMGCPVPAQ